MPVPPEIIVAQVEAVASDIGVDAVKIGMLADEATIEAVIDSLDLLADTTGRPRRQAPARPEPTDLAPELRDLLAAVEEGRGALGELAGDADQARRVLAGLGELEFRGLIRRTFGGRYEPAAE